MTKKKQNRKEQGQSLAEMAISITILFVLLAGLVDGSRLFFDYMAIRDAAQEGVNYAIYKPTDTAGIIARVRSASDKPIDLQDTSIVTVPNPTFNGPACNGTIVTVTVTTRFDVTAPFFGALIGKQNFPLTTTASGTIISPTCGH